jgi:hypothetical protein
LQILIFCKINTTRGNNQYNLTTPAHPTSSSP